MRLLKLVREAIKISFVACLGLVLYVVASTSGAGWLYVISAALASVVLVSLVAPLYNTRGIEVRRRAPATGVAGEPVRCEIEIRNTGPLARYLIEVSDRFAGGEGGGVIARVGRGAPERFAYEVESPKRGVYQDGEIAVASAAPFGLLRGRRRSRANSTTIIYPRTFQIAGLPRTSDPEPSGTDLDESPEMHRGLGGDFWGVREYRPGDPTRLIAWRQSARSLASGRLSVVELARETAPPLSISVDLDQRAPEAAREMAVSATASLLLQALREGRDIIVDAGPQQAVFPENPDPDGILAWCAGLEASRPPAEKRTSFAIVASLKNPRLPDAGTVVLVSCHEFAGPGEWMSPQEERDFGAKIEASGSGFVYLGPDLREPWRIS